MFYHGEKLVGKPDRLDGAEMDSKDRQQQMHYARPNLKPETLTVRDGFCELSVSFQDPLIQFFSPKTKMQMLPASPRMGLTPHADSTVI